MTDHRPEPNAEQRPRRRGRPPKNGTHAMDARARKAAQRDKAKQLPYITRNTDLSGVRTSMLLELLAYYVKEGMLEPVTRISEVLFERAKANREKIDSTRRG